MVPQLNWKELSLLVEKTRPHVEGLFLERIIVPERSHFPGGFQKGEWTLRFSGKREEGVLTFSIRPRQSYLTWRSGKGPKASTQATHSAFDLALSKHLKGAKLLRLETLPRERIVTLIFQGLLKNQSLALVLVLIPAAPEGLLVALPEGDGPNWTILARSRSNAEVGGVFTPPQGASAPPNPEVRDALVVSTESYLKEIEKELSAEAFALRVQATEKALKQFLKHAEDRHRQTTATLKEATHEADWQQYGDLLKASIGLSGGISGELSGETPTETSGTVRYVMDFATGERVGVPCDPKLDLKEQIQKFYLQAKRKLRRIEEAKGRLEDLREKVELLQQRLMNKPKWDDWEELTRWEAIPGLSPHPPAEKGKNAAPKHEWTGKAFTSKDGLTIWAGRSRDENMELTFKWARGNDLWFHVRGKPGAHVVVFIPPGKSAPLETLLDAANLTVHYSGGANWGKTEVDYTFKKHVKRIKGTSEASYTHNKTLIVNPEPERLKRLLGGITSQNS